MKKILILFLSIALNSYASDIAPKPVESETIVWVCGRNIFHNQCQIDSQKTACLACCNFWCLKRSISIVEPDKKGRKCIECKQPLFIPKKA